MEVADFNEEFYETCLAVTFKYNRSMAVANFTMKPKIEINNQNTQLIVQAYKFYSNEYRTFPIRFQLNYCNTVSRNLFGIKAAFTSCGNMSICNLDKVRIILSQFKATLKLHSLQYILI